MKTSPKIYKVLDHSNGDQDQTEKYSKVYDPERMERVKRFLFDNPKNGYCNIKAVIDQYNPFTYDSSDFTVNVSKETQKRFISWYGSNVCVKMLMTFENNLLNYGSNDRSKYAKQAFLIEHVLRIREIYQKAISFDKLVINDFQDYKHFILFLEQIRYFMCYEINQVEPLKLPNLKNKIFHTFANLCSDITEISDFNDVQKIIDVSFNQYYFECNDRTSLQPLDKPSDIYTFSLMVHDTETNISLFDNFTDIDWSDIYEPELDAFLKDPLERQSKIESSIFDNPFKGLIDINDKNVDPF
jgi:hypothetical protein